VVGRRSRQKEADVSSTVIFLLALKDHVETRDHLLASERARVRAPWGRGGLYSLSNSFCVARKASGGEHSSWRCFMRACARIYEIPPAPSSISDRARFSCDTSRAARTTSRNCIPSYLPFILVKRFQNARNEGGAGERRDQKREIIR